MITADINSLRQRIFERGHSNISYLVMNDRTRSEVIGTFLKDYVYEIQDGARYGYGVLFEIPVAICEKVEDNKIELV